MMAEGVCPAGESCDGPVRVPLTLTNVLYEKGDLLGLVLAWFSLLPIFILVGFATLVLFNRNIHTVFYCAGLVLNEVVNFILKHLIRHPRPDTALMKDPLFQVYGMPSSHAQFMAFFAAYFTAFVWIRVKFSAGMADQVWKSVAAAVSIIAALITCISRYYLGYHTICQILCGMGLGCGLGVAWFIVVHVWCSPFFGTICSWGLSEMCFLKDVSKIPNYMWFEYTSARVESLKRTRSKSS